MKIIRTLLIGLVSTTLIQGATADVVAVVSRDSSLDTLTRYELINIFLGKTYRLGDGSQVVPIDQRENSSVREEFYSRYAGKSSAQLKAYWSRMIFTGRGRPPRSLEDGRRVKQWVAENTNAIGYIDSELVDSSIKIIQVK